MLVVPLGWVIILYYLDDFFAILFFSDDAFVYI